MRNVYLVLHIVGVCLWLGANGVLAFMGSRWSTASTEVRAWWAESQAAMARVLYNIAGGLILVTGILLAAQAKVLKATFVSVGFAAIIAGAAMGMLVFGPGARQLAQAVRSGREAEANRLQQRLAAFGLLDTVIVVIAIVAMVGKWGL